MRNRLSIVTRLSLGLFAAFVAMSIAYTGASLQPRVTASTSNALTGYAWSSNVGWISLSGSGYGVVINSDKSLSGYAWGDNVGWVSFNPNSCGAAPTYNPSNQSLSGWARALNGVGSDGCISLSGSGYGVVLNGSHSYAWGSDTIGWLDFGYSVQPCPNGNGMAGQCTTCDSGYTLIGGTCYVQCPNGSGAAGSCSACNSGYVLQAGNCVLPSGSVSRQLTATPNRVKSGGSSSLSWTTSSMTSCILKDDTNHTLSTQTSSSGTAVTNITRTTVYTLTCQDNAQSYTSTASVSLLPVYQEI